MTKIKAVYKPKTLFSGGFIGKSASDQYVAVPNHYKDNQILILYKDQRMVINEWSEAETYRTFEDKFNRKKNYTLGYFKFVPEGSETWQEQSQVEEKQQKLI